MEHVEAAPTAQPGAATRMDQGRFVSFSLPQFRYLMAGTASSQVAGWMDQVASGVLVWQLTNSPFQLGLIGFIRGFSQLLVSPFAGVLVDRVDRRQLAAVTQVVPAIVAAAIGVLAATGAVQMWHLYVLVCVGGVATAINMPARQVLVYDVVGTGHLTNAIGLNSVVSNIARISAPIPAGISIAAVGIGPTYYAEAAFFGLATVATFVLRPMAASKPVHTPMWQGIHDGVTYVRGDRTVLLLVLLNVIPNLIIYPYVAMMPIFAEDILHVGSTGLGVLLTGVGIGSIPGGLVVAGMTGSRRKGLTMGIAALLYMGMVAVFALSTVFLVSIVILIVAGVGWSMMVTLNQTLLQLNVADAYRGRVLALYTMAGGFGPFGNLAMGASADYFGVQASVTVFALTGFMLAAALGLGSARMRRL